MTRTVARENSQAAEDKDPGAIRPDRIGYRKLNGKIVEDRPDPAISADINNLIVKLNGID